MRRGQINPRSWDAALAAVKEGLVELPNHIPVSEEQDRMLATVFALCDQLTAKKCLPVVPTTRELAKKYGVCERTVRYWRREGCPFAKGQPHVLHWLARRRYAPEGAQAKFGQRLERLKSKAMFDVLQTIRAEILALRFRYLQHGLRPPDWLRGMPFRAR